MIADNSLSTLSTPSAASGASERIPGSFRDPSGYVFVREGRIFRAIDTECATILRALEKSGLLASLATEGLIVQTTFVEDKDPELAGALAAENPGYTHFLEHARIPFVSYPYEWCASMLADAGGQTVALQKKLLGSGFSLKDATAYNIQFVKGKPIFIDLPSIEQPARLDVWFALAQFSQMFLFPLMLFRHHGWDLRSYFLGSLGGRDLGQVSSSLGRLEKWGPRALFDVTLPLHFQRKADSSKTDTGEGRAALEKTNKDPKVQLFILDSLQRKLKKMLAGYKTGGAWADYTTTCSYDNDAEKSKKKLVREYLEVAGAKHVLDIGCNTGDYSYLAAETGASVLAADGDHDAIEGLYARLKAKPANIEPLVIDLGNPSPAIGFMNEERSSFFARLTDSKVDCVLALALIHHLLVSGNLSLPAIRDMFYAMTSDYLILEYVPTDDVMFRRLMRFRVDLFKDLTLDSCRAVFEERFEVVRETLIPGSPRTLWLLKKKR